MHFFDRFFDVYFVNNFVLLIMLGGMTLLTVYDVYLEKRALMRLRLTILAIFILSVFEYAEECFSSLPEPTVWRTLFSALCYTLRPGIILMIIFSVFQRVPKVVVIPEIVNTLIVFSAFFTDIAFSFTSDNSFQRGPLGYTPHIVSGIYLACLIWLSVRAVSKNSAEERFVVFYIAVMALIAGYLSTKAYDQVVIPTYASCLLLYYLFIYAKNTKNDTLTGLLNRQSLYADSEKRADSIRGVISIDMNELKWLNDNFGHEKGDQALVTVSECFLKHLPSGDRVYRIGGDEFVVLSRSQDESRLAEIVDKMRTSVDEAGYSCAFGFSTGKGVEEMIKEADRRMYEDKAAIKAANQAGGKKVHLRD